jgi:hypothetical protein
MISHHQTLSSVSRIHVHDAHRPAMTLQCALSCGGHLGSGDAGSKHAECEPPVLGVSLLSVTCCHLLSP